MKRPCQSIKISIITVVLNGEETIQNTIDSVLVQTYQNIEYIIIDGSSTDGTIGVVKSYGDKITKFVSEPDKGLYDAMNKGIDMATGDIIGILNSDDFYVNNNVIGLVEKDLNPKPHFPSVHSCVILSKNSSINYLKSS